MVTVSRNCIVLFPYNFEHASQYYMNNAKGKSKEGFLNYSKIPQQFF